MGTWKIGKYIEANDVFFDTVPLQDIVQYSVEKHEEKFLTISAGWNCNVYMKARRLRWTKDGRIIGKKCGFNTLSKDCIFQILLTSAENESFIVSNTSTNQSAIQLAFFALSFSYRRYDDLFCLFTRCTNLDGDKLQIPGGLVSFDQLQIVLMCDSVRRVGLYHYCNYEGDGGTTESCRHPEPQLSMKHKSSLLEGGLMFVQRRPNGYPPRVA